MNIEQAKAIPIVQILDNLQVKLARKTDREHWYFSPFRTENTASFHVHPSKNLWFDFGEAIGGDQIRLIQTVLEKQGRDASVSAALKWLADQNIVPLIDKACASVSKNDKPHAARSLKLKSTGAIRNIALLHYLERRGIPLEIANRHTKQVQYVSLRTGKTMFALGWKNEEDGYELHNPNFKGCIGQKHITFIRGTKPKPPGIHFFEGMTDYLSVIAQQNGKPFTQDSIILNSVSCIGCATPYIKGYGYSIGYTWMDNDQAGKKATQILIQMFKEENIAHCPMNAIYKPFKDVNAWHMQRLDL